MVIIMASSMIRRAFVAGPLRGDGLAGLASPLLRSSLCSSRLPAACSRLRQLRSLSSTPTRSHGDHSEQPDAACHGQAHAADQAAEHAAEHAAIHLATHEVQHRATEKLGFKLLEGVAELASKAGSKQAGGLAAWRLTCER